MLKNFHTHTYRCHHAKGTEREYIEWAIKKGIKILGFSDHNPCFFEGDYYSNYRMTPDQAEEYFTTLQKLKKEYENDINILAGLEVEYYPKHFQKFIDFIMPFNPDYLILGQHYTKNEYDGLRCLNGGVESDLVDYVNQTIEGLETGYFSYLAHPDVLNYSGSQEFFINQMSKLCKRVKELEIPLEYNLLGAMEGRYYPMDKFFRLAKKFDNEVILGLDAHSVEPFERLEELEGKALEYLNGLGVKITDNIKLLNGKTV